jgi:hypothetical protein
MNNSDNVYSIPVRFRKMENLHIVFWLFKDISWCMVWRPLGIAMIFPTLIISIIIAWRTRHLVSELTHNLAISFWISANSLWMVSEFFHFDEKILFLGLTGKHSAMIPFLLGLSMLIYYYAWWKPRHKDELETM